MEQIASLTETAFQKLLDRMPMDEKDISNLKQAQPISKDLVDYDPLDIGYAAIMGKIELGLGRSEDAEVTLQNALLIKPKDADDQDALIRAGVHADLSQIAFSQKKFEVALKEIQTARKELPQDPYFMTYEASTLIELERFGEAKDLCKEALKIDPGHKPAADLLKLLGESSPKDGS